ncbi:MAG: DUF2339 domain-containing protein [Wolbachia endosymbiont of Homalodisca vitripennis]|nr:DUF2339 domain-containing protein [Wolbachia endosymbiont of Homalodisca vitripennis]
MSCNNLYESHRHIFHVNENVLFVKAGFFERGVITNVLFLYGLACLWVGRHFTRQAVSLSGIVLSVIAMFRICYFDLLIYNPLWSSQAVGKFLIFNALLLTYGLPIVWTSKIISHIKKVEWKRYSYIFMLLLSFVLVSLNVRQMFHGEYLNKYEISNFEIYSYSIIWLIFGIILLLFGALQQNQSTRIASLVVMILTVGKVFLYDASELTGLLRVFSFFGLGLSWFYAQFVFRKCEK